MDISTKILSEITVYMKYAKFLPNKDRRETWKELVDRNIEAKKVDVKKDQTIKSKTLPETKSKEKEPKTKSKK